MSYIKDAYFDSIVRSQRQHAIAVAPIAPVVPLAPIAPEPAPLLTPRRQAAIAKAQYYLAGGLDIRQAPDGATLVPSGTRGGTVHRVRDGVCSCESGQHGRPCWHAEAALLHGN